MTVSRVGIIGLGLVGSSVARGLQPQVEVVGVDPDPDTMAAAETAGISVVAEVSQLSDCDAILLAAPTGTNSQLLQDEIASGISRPVVDLGSVKHPIQQAWLAADPNFPFVGTHPMSGSESAGFAAGSADMFADAAWPVVVHELTDPAALLTVIELITVLGGRPVPVSAGNHDAAVALVSHLPHLLAGGLGQALHGSPAQQELALRLAGGSYRDASRVSSSPADRTAEFLVANGQVAAAAARAAAESLQQVAVALAAGEETTVADWLSPATSSRLTFRDRWQLHEQRELVGDPVSLHRDLLRLRDTSCWVERISGNSPGSWQLLMGIPESPPHD
ncbi:MAG: prephenate dehydrogenase/arogenate dehydrogenase family protein [Actinomycetia bacterium]|nr:prephenate dehydrogenase/arogenate dehydrogenase family protein [Actinomycetes bacterium]MCH9800839.1 prephenate dehydrogenase/arogenate dehydrogenase family protein [Actinomycetes bacterium]